MKRRFRDIRTGEGRGLMLSPASSTMSTIRNPNTFGPLQTSEKLDDVDKLKEDLKSSSKDLRELPFSCGSPTWPE